jgi:DNA-directed RNA polymerase II subunit RPB1
LKAARHGELDEMRGVSANIMCGQTGYYGTSAFSVYLDVAEFEQRSKEARYLQQQITVKEKDDDHLCSYEHLKFTSNLGNQSVTPLIDNNYVLDDL